MRRSLFALILIAISTFTAEATVVVPLSFDQLVNESQSVVYGRVSDVRAQWSADRRYIESVVTVDILRGMKGNAATTVTFTAPGGQVGSYVNVIPGAPAFAPGDLAVFFLTAQGARLPVTTGFTQGIYRVRRDAASGEMLVLPPVVETGRIVRGDARRKPVSLTAFEGSVRSAASR